MSDKIYVSFKDAKTFLPKGSHIHTFMDAGITIIGADHSRKDLLKTMQDNEKTLQLTGEAARSMNHGLVVFEGGEPLFIETDEDKLKAFEETL